jgi:hypothetical protein
MGQWHCKRIRNSVVISAVIYSRGKQGNGEAGPLND